MRFRSKMKKWPCNGYTVSVCRDPADAFPLYLGNEERQFKAAANVLKHASGELSGGNKAKAEQLLIQLNEANQSLQADFNAIYMVFASDPCRDRDYLEKKIDEIRHSRIYMETLFAHIRAIQVALENNAPADLVMAAIERAFADTVPPFVKETVTLVKEAPHEIDRWRQPAVGASQVATELGELEPNEDSIVEAEIVEGVEISREVNGGDSHE